MADTWDTIRAEREAAERQRAAIIEAMRAAGHDPEVDLYRRLIVCCRAREEGATTLRCTMEVDPDAIADAAFVDALLDRVRAMTCKLRPLPRATLTSIPPPDGEPVYVAKIDCATGAVALPDCTCWTARYACPAHPWTWVTPAVIASPWFVPRDEFFALCGPLSASVGSGAPGPSVERMIHRATTGEAPPDDDPPFPGRY